MNAGGGASAVPEAAAVVPFERVSAGRSCPLTSRAQSSPQQPRLDTTGAEAPSPGQQDRHSGPTGPARRARPKTIVMSRMGRRCWFMKSL